MVLCAATAARRRQSGPELEALLAAADWRRLTGQLRAARLLPTLGPRVVALAGGLAPTEFGAELEAAHGGLPAPGRAAGADLDADRGGAGGGRDPLPAASRGRQLGEAVYGEPGRRLSGDIDLLVAPARARARGRGRARPRLRPADRPGRRSRPAAAALRARPRARRAAAGRAALAHPLVRVPLRRRAPAGAASRRLREWRPQPAAELAALLLFYARDGFTGLRQAADLGAWWDRFGGELPPGGIGEIAAAYPQLAPALEAALKVAETSVGLPAGADPPAVRAGLAPAAASPSSLADPRPYASAAAAVRRDRPDRRTAGTARRPAGLLPPSGGTAAGGDPRPRREGPRRRGQLDRRLRRPHARPLRAGAGPAPAPALGGPLEVLDLSRPAHFFAPPARCSDSDDPASDPQIQLGAPLRPLALGRRRPARGRGRPRALHRLPAGPAGRRSRRRPQPPVAAARRARHGVAATGRARPRLQRGEWDRGDPGVAGRLRVPGRRAAASSSSPTTAPTRTAERARAAGAEVWERFDAERRGKGCAVAWALERLLRRGGFDAVVMVDADCTVSANLLSAVDRPPACRRRRDAGRLRRRQPRGLARLGAALRRLRARPTPSASSASSGSGSPAAWSVPGWRSAGALLERGALDRRPGLVEDGEYHMRLVLAGERAEFVARGLGQPGGADLDEGQHRAAGALGTGAGWS